MLSRTLVVRRTLPAAKFVVRNASYSMFRIGTLVNQPRNLTTKSKTETDDVLLRVKVAPIKRVGEDIEKKRARLIYQSRKRGILEADILLSGFAAKHLKVMSIEEINEYDQLLNELDWDIYYWATKNYTVTPLPEKWRNSVVLRKLQEYSENKEKKILKMPDLSEF
ncbi:succinate dehydrogenase assembly factor SDH5 Ecym_5276 [Eremothecium cymbalariae DBVPG|uniref:Succinate dehydrogenase assembly factor 2, mitochondrial n=1 Tax=Eremothecium cymbalariae (strain CBS 270.75 / DBVPG 7215 / KCTC 17166 / NRRL Y-17582) TaxID=931890 RepID=I6ND97_ERECY|nr:hypothetical protein Ecym_5276 [Eremothecium cymbalariae DBVPG\